MEEIYIKSSAEEEKHICSICGEEYIGYGNNAQPVNDGRCCGYHAIFRNRELCPVL